MKKVYQIISTVALSMLAIGSFGQNADLSRPKSMHPVSPSFKNGSDYRSQLKRLSVTPGVLLNWDTADDYIIGGGNPGYSFNNGERMNMHYNLPADSAIDYIVVAFDTMFDPYAQLGYPIPAKIKIDSIYVSLAAVNHSGINDTLDVQVNSVDAKGYPTATILLDQKVIGTNIGIGSNLISIQRIGFNANITAGRFCVTVKYYGSHADSCYFIYGFPSFLSGVCTNFSNALLANPTNWYNVYESPKFVANSFEQWSEYATYGILPTSAGANVFYPCTTDANYVQGTDGDNFYQDINVFAMVDLNPADVNEVADKGFSVSQNAPNPFNVQSQITYNLTKSSDVVFSVYDMTGRQLMNNSLSTVAPGQHVITISANQFTPGVYLYTFNVNGNVVTKRMVITQ